MNESYVEFSAWNEPISDDIFTINERSQWLFTAPFKTTTSLINLQLWINDLVEDNSPREVAGIMSRVVLKVRSVTVSPWVRI